MIKLAYWVGYESLIWRVVGTVGEELLVLARRKDEASGMTKVVRRHRVDAIPVHRVPMNIFRDKRYALDAGSDEYELFREEARKQVKQLGEAFGKEKIQKSIGGHVTEVTIGGIPFKVDSDFEAHWGPAAEELSRRSRDAIKRSRHINSIFSEFINDVVDCFGGSLDEELEQAIKDAEYFANWGQLPSVLPARRNNGGRAQFFDDAEHFANWGVI